MATSGARQHSAIRPIDPKTIIRKVPNAEDQPILHLTLDHPLQPFLFTTLITLVFQVVIQRLKTADVGADLPAADEEDGGPGRRADDNTKR
ncbi:hypothetical protein TYRP_003802 [Tyrophagus putrescentiae]|nr:hypothetical protein TYRP_003802 [Tyrophagus putrescentiae]